VIEVAGMNTSQAAKRLKVSVRSLQRLANKHNLSVSYQRGRSGKQEAQYNAGEIDNLKKELAQPVAKENTALATIPDASRQTQIVAPQFVNALTHLLEGIQQRGAADRRSTSSEVAIENKPLLKLDEASRLTGLSRGMLKEAVVTGKLNARIIGRAWRIKRGDLDVYINKL
jgi:excisionase family DNA binding protein